MTEKQRTAQLSVFSNTLLVVLKLIVGFYTGAVSIVSEAAHSAVDLLAAVIAYYAVRQADRPPDERHAFGHGKFENLSGAIEAMLIVVAAIWIVYEAAGKLFKPHTPEMLEYGMALMLLSVVVNIFVSRRLMKVAKKTGSQALEADALHLQADVWTSAGVLIGLAVIRITGWAWIDPAIALLVALIVFKAGYDMTRKSFQELTDISLPQEEEEQIKEIVARHNEIVDYHKLRTRRSGSHRQVDMHIVLYREMHLAQAHAVADQLEGEIGEALAPCEVVIHLEPCDPEKYAQHCPLQIEPPKK
ncbi:cation diffusion facilitator family transporter [Azotosporobacter soli]|uniref:cation diffusion facilitator family transporter n=1 Tax=Azotosporobacter soli TaxID=3055040 RepID=UPI0031FF0B00